MEEMDQMEGMSIAEIARQETEHKMLYKFMLMINQSKDLEELEEKVKALLNK